MSEIVEYRKKYKMAWMDGISDQRTFQFRRTMTSPQWNVVLCTSYWVPVRCSDTAGQVTASSISCFTVTDCPSHAPVHRRWLGISGCCCTYLEQSVSAHHISVLTSSLQSSSEDLPFL